MQVAAPTCRHTSVAWLSVGLMLAPNITLSNVKWCSSSYNLHLHCRRTRRWPNLRSAGRFAMDRTYCLVQLTATLTSLFVVFSNTGELHVCSPIYLIAHAKQSRCICWHYLFITPRHQSEQGVKRSVCQSSCCQYRPNASANLNRKLATFSSNQFTKSNSAPVITRLIGLYQRRITISIGGKAA